MTHTPAAVSELLLAAVARALRLRRVGVLLALAAVPSSAIAAALARRGESISKSGAEVLSLAWEQFAAEPFVDNWLRRLYAAAWERVSKPRD